MAAGSAVARRELLAELARLRDAESSFDGELQQIFSNITNKKLEGGAQGGAVAGSKKPSGSAAFDATDLSNNVRRVEQFAPCYEAMVQDSKKLVVQVEDCRALSDRLSVMVRRLDLKQSRAQQALSCTDDIISLKECKVKLQSAIDDGNLPLAVGCIRQVHAIDKQISSSCDDYAAILSAEQTVKSLVQSEFSTAIQASDLDKVVALCPLLQTLGLEAEARDSFLDFIEATVFIGVSADASAVDDATDPATGYAQALSNIFNSTYVILQQYLPMVIQGLDRSLGDVHFIKRLHAKCEAEAGLVLKRYMKFRGVQAMIAAIKSSGSSSSGSSSGSGIGGIGGMGAGSKTGPVASADLHAMLDELALLIQYCCLYSRYLKQLCAGAESRTRGAALPSHSPAPDAASASASASAIAPPPADSPSPSPSPSPQSVFGGPAEFDRMVDELVNRYYMEGERALMQAAARSAFPRSAGTGAGSGSGAGSGAGAGSGSGSGAGSGAGGEDASAGLDECFFVLQRCGQRAVATNNIHAACAVLHSLSDLLAGQVLTRAQEALAAAVARAAAGVAEHVGRLVGSAGGGGGGAGGGGADATALAKGLKSAMSLASSIAASGTGATTSTGPGSGSSSSSGSASNASSNNASGGLGGGSDEDEDRWGLARPLEVFNAVERCARYTDRLARDVGAAGATVFSSASSGSGSGSSSSSSSSSGSSSSSSGGKKGGTGAGAGAGGSSELDKLRLCREDFDAAKLAFTQVCSHYSFVSFPPCLLASPVCLLACN